MSIISAQGKSFTAQQVRQSGQTVEFRALSGPALW
jgi:hypothetical protein